MSTRPYTTCLCTPGDPCVACPLAHPCDCGAKPGQRCRRPSGHSGHFVMTHETRLLASDADAIARDPADVEARLLAQRNDPAAMKAWTRALRNLARNTHIWQGRIDSAVIERYIALARGERSDEAEQLTLDLQ